MGTRASVISICKGPALTKARLLGAAVRILPARRPALPDRPLLRLPHRPLPAGSAWSAPARAGRRATRFLAAAPCSRPAGTTTARPQPGRGSPSLFRCLGRQGAQGLAHSAGSARGLPPGRGAGVRGSGLRAYRVPGLRRLALPRGPWPRAHSGLGGGGGSCSGTAAPSALGSRLGRGHPKLWTQGRKGQARAGRRSQGDAGPGAAPPPRLAQLGPLREERWAPPGPSRGPFPPLHPFHGDCASGGRSTEESGPGLAVTLGRLPRRFELGSSGACRGVYGGGQQRSTPFRIASPSFQRHLHKSLCA